MKRECVRKNTPQILLFGAALLLVSVSARADECPEFDAEQKKYEEAKTQLEGVSDTSKEGILAKRKAATAEYSMKLALNRCEDKKLKEAKETENAEKCAKKQASYKNEFLADKKNKGEEPAKIYEWKNGKCVNHTDTKNISDGDECNNASVFTEFKGKNCKTAMDAVKDVRTRNSAITESTTAATTAYSGMQAMQATGAQDDAQARQKNVYQALALSKLATGALNLQGAMQLKSAASGAEDASSTITSAQQNLAQACAGASDEQACFYQNAQRLGMEQSTLNYANIERMKRAAAQSHDQAEAANALAKQSMITGAADMLVGLQAMRMAQTAGQNAQAMAPPPVFVPPPPGMVNFGSGQSVGEPMLGTGATSAPVDYGNPSDATTFGALNKGRIEGTMEPGRRGNPTVFKAASSGVSGGGGGGSASSGRSSRGGGGKAGGKSGPRNSALGEIKNGSGVGFKGGNSGEGGAGGAANPFADALAKLFPQDQNGKPVVDARNIASGGSAFGEEDAQSETEVTSADLSLFEQITAKYRQLDGSGRF